MRVRRASPEDAPPQAPGREGLSIGDLAELCGIGESTLRAWERRYGRPQAERRPSGHRRYSREDVTWLRRVAEALTRGGRPAQIVRLDETQLDAFLGAKNRAATDSDLTDRMLEWVQDFDGARLRRSLREAWNRMTPLEFLDQRLAPLLDAVGRAWADGRLEIRHEHFLSEVVDDLLRSLRERMTESSAGPLVLLATLPDEQHALGLQMAATALVAQGGRPRVLGVNSPIEQIVAAAAEMRVRGVAISVSLSSGGVASDKLLAALRKALPPEVGLAAGGEGMRSPRRGAAGITRILDLGELGAWVARLDEPLAPR
jgi:DNA-binding transcriptional MerR regulator